MLTPVFDEGAEGNETAGVTLMGSQSANNGYTVDAPSQVQIISVDFVDGVFRDSLEDLLD
jgi:hypothetical protein